MAEAITTTDRKEKLVVHDDGQFSNLLDTARFEHMYRIAQMYSKSKLVPEHFQNKPEDCYIAIQMAVRLGVDPFMMLQNTYIVHGRPGMEAKLAIALINSSGIFAGPLAYEIAGKDPKAADYQVRAYATLKATGEVVHGPWVDWSLVKAEGWYDKAGSKWKTMPGLMFMYRAATLFGRTVCPERLMGMQTKEELLDIGPTKQAHVLSVESAAQVLEREEKAGTFSTIERVEGTPETITPTVQVETMPTAEPAAPPADPVQAMFNGTPEPAPGLDAKQAEIWSFCLAESDGDDERASIALSELTEFKGKDGLVSCKDIAKLKGKWLESTYRKLQNMLNR